MRPIEGELESRIVDNYLQAVAGIRRRFISRLRTRFDAEDMVHDAVLDILRKPMAMLATNDPCKMLVFVAHRRMIDHYRHAVGQPGRPQEFPSSPWM